MRAPIDHPWRTGEFYKDLDARPAETHRQCRVCRESKPMEAFRRRFETRRVCRDCRYARDRDLRAANTARWLAYNRHPTRMERERDRKRRQNEARRRAAGVVAPPRRWWTTYRVAAELCLSVDSVRRWLRLGKLAGAKCGWRWRIDPASVRTHTTQEAA